MERLDKLKNVITAMITPFKLDMSIDEVKYREINRTSVDRLR